MKTLLCTGTATASPHHGQAALWRWFYYYLPLAERMGVTHFAVSNDGHLNIPVETIVQRGWGGSDIQVEPVPGVLRFIVNPVPLGRKSMSCYPGVWRNYRQLADYALQFNFDKMIYIEWDFFINPASRMPDEVGKELGRLVCYWCLRHQFPEPGLFISSKKGMRDLVKCAQAKLDAGESDTELAEQAIPWSIRHRHRVGDRYPEFTRDLPDNWSYCAQLPLHLGIQGNKIVKLLDSICPKCGVGSEDFNSLGLLDCQVCNPRAFTPLAC